MHWPTTKGEHFTGDGIKMSEAISIKSIDLEWLQDFRGVGGPKIKPLAAEALLASVALSWMRTTSASRMSSARMTTPWVRCGRASRLSAWL